MNDGDRGQFKALLDGLCEAYDKDKMSKMALQIYFEAMRRFDIDQVLTAASAHLADPKHGTFFPKVADLIRQIEGGEVTTDHVIAAARAKSTPFGILCRIQIGTFDLDNQTDMFYLKQRAQECLDLLPEWKARAAAGEYTDHEISIMIKHEVDPTGSFDNGLDRPANVPLLTSRINQIVQTPRHKFLLEPPHEEAEGDKLLEVDDSVRNFLATI